MNVYKFVSMTRVLFEALVQMQEKAHTAGQTKDNMEAYGRLLAAHTRLYASRDNDTSWDFNDLFNEREVNRAEQGIVWSAKQMASRATNIWTNGNG